ncbi:hypothetical protein [Confluentibacter flavum]|uniref:Helix-turn-helix domain-containing protein n=1 Tax=Confluentibacter flavum TaxID=1909700 RepID=A0A2N3HMA1_9FLAO|nr:hypothetical protein [Confluentibacter flavum]PKQ46067.1 hypothetical protein CSW08_04820 [Confluentibacter flavum]
MERITISRKKCTEQLGLSIRTIDRYLSEGRFEAFKPAYSTRVLIYEDTVTEENLKAIKPKYKNW